MSRLGVYDIRLEGDEELNALLSRMEGHHLDALLRLAVVKGAQAMKPFVTDRAPVSPTLGGSRMSHRTYPGDLKASIKVRKGKASAPPAAVITPGHKAFWYSKWVVTGTKPHQIRFPDQRARGVPKEGGNIAHPGNTHPNPFYDRGAADGGGFAVTAMKNYINEYIDEVSKF